MASLTAFARPRRLTVTNCNDEFFDAKFFERDIFDAEFFERDIFEPLILWAALQLVTIALAYTLRHHAGAIGETGAARPHYPGIPRY